MLHIESALRYETYQERVTTHTECETYEHGRQVDVSPVAITEPHDTSKSTKRVKLSKKYEFGDELTAQDFHRKSEAFRDRNRGPKHVQT